MKYLISFVSFIKESIQLNDNFWKWFRNSKIVDENNKPLVVYHGSNNWDFEEFEKSWIGLTDEGYYGIGFYFSKYLEEAKTFGENIYSCYLRCQNPFRLISVSNRADERWFDLRDQLADLKGIDLPHLKTIRTLPEGFYVKKIRDTYDKYDLYGVYPPESTYGTEKEIYGADTYSELAAIVAFNDTLNDINYDYGWTPGLINKIGKQKFTDLIKQNGYDSIIVGDKFGEICVFESNQIKSINNNGSWNIEDNNINS
jgi:hypothetical protein